VIALPRTTLPVLAEDRRAISRELLQWLGHDLLPGLAERPRPTAVQTSDYTARSWDYVKCRPSGGAFAVTLPAAAEPGAVVWVKVDENDATTVTVTAAAGDDIDGAATYTVAAAWAERRFTYDATERRWSQG
jgi:hypothetical protein